MKGLLLKDFYSLKTEYKMYGIILPFLVLFMVLTGTHSDENLSPGSFGYLATYTVIAALGLTTNSFTYDEKYGYAQYVLATPTSRRLYVAGKYVFHLINAAFGALLGLTGMLVMSLILGASLTFESIMGGIVFVGGSFLATALLGIWQIGLSVRFESVKARLIFVGLILGVTILTVAGTLYGILSTDYPITLIPTLIEVVVAGLTIWMFVMSFVWMKKKEF